MSDIQAAAERERIFQTELRLTHWLREFGQKSTVAFQNDIRVALEEMKQRRAELDPTRATMQWLADQPGMQLSCGVYFLGPFGIWYTGNGDVTEMRCGGFTLRNPTRGQIRTLLRLVSPGKIP